MGISLRPHALEYYSHRPLPEGMRTVPPTSEQLAKESGERTERETLESGEPKTDADKLLEELRHEPKIPHYEEL